MKVTIISLPLTITSFIRSTVVKVAWDAGGRRPPISNI